MKKIKVIIVMLVFISLSLYARPQFFVGAGVKGGRMYPSEYVMTDLKNNARYSSTSVGIDYIFYIVPEAEFTFIPAASFPLGLTMDIGYGFVSGRNDGKNSYSYALKSNGENYNSSDNYRYGSDDVLSLSAGLRYIHLAVSEKYFSLTGFITYNYDRFSLSKIPLGKGSKGSEKDTLVINEHSLSLGLGIMGRYDKSYLKVESEIRKDIDWEKGLSSLLDPGYTLTISVSVGFVFTILKNNEFMR